MDLSLKQMDNKERVKTSSVSFNNAEERQYRRTGNPVPGNGVSSVTPVFAEKLKRTNKKTADQLSSKTPMGANNFQHGNFDSRYIAETASTKNTSVDDTPLNLVLTPIPLIMGPAITSTTGLDSLQHNSLRIKQERQDVKRYDSGYLQKYIPDVVKKENAVSNSFSASLNDVCSATSCQGKDQPLAKEYSKEFIQKSVKIDGTEAALTSSLLTPNETIRVKVGQTQALNSFGGNNSDVGYEFFKMLALMKEGAMINSLLPSSDTLKGSDIRKQASDMYISFSAQEHLTNNSNVGKIELKVPTSRVLSSDVVSSAVADDIGCSSALFSNCNSDDVVKNVKEEIYQEQVPIVGTTSTEPNPILSEEISSNNGQTDEARSKNILPTMVFPIMNKRKVRNKRFPQKNMNVETNSTDVDQKLAVTDDNSVDSDRKTNLDQTPSKLDQLTDSQAAILDSVVSSSVNDVPSVAGSSWMTWEESWGNLAKSYDVLREKKHELSEEEQQKLQTDLSEFHVEEEQEKDSARKRAVRSTMSEEKLSAMRQLDMIRARRNRASMTPEQREAIRAANAEKARKRRAAMTPEQRNAVRAANAARQRQKRAEMTPEQREISRRLNAERARKARWAKMLRSIQTQKEALEQDNAYL